MNRKITTAPCPCPHVVHRHLRRHCGPWMSEKRCTEPHGRDNHVTRRALRGTAKETKSTVGIRRDCPRCTGDLTALTLKLWGGPPISLTSAFSSDRFSILTRALALLDTSSITRSKNPGFPILVNSANTGKSYLTILNTHTLDHSRLQPYFAEPQGDVF